MLLIRNKLVRTNFCSAKIVHNSLVQPQRCKSYIHKHLRGQLPRDLKDIPGALGCLYGTLPDVDEFGQFVLPQ